MFTEESLRTVSLLTIKCEYQPAKGKFTQNPYKPNHITIYDLKINLKIQSDYICRVLARRPSLSPTELSRYVG